MLERFLIALVSKIDARRMDQSKFDWFRFAKCVAISIVAGLSPPLIWKVLLGSISPLNTMGGGLVLLAGTLSLYVLDFPWYLVLDWKLLLNHWYYYTFANAIFWGSVWGIASARVRRPQRS